MQISVLNGMMLVLVVTHDHWLSSLHRFSSFSVPWKGDMHESHGWVHLSSGFWMGLANKNYQQEVKC